MALRDDIQADIAEAFDDDLADAVQSVAGRRETTGVYDPTTGTSPSTVTNYTGRGVFGGYSVREIDGQHVLATDTKLTALQNELINTTTDSVDEGSIEAPQEGDMINGLRVVRVQKDPAAATWSVTLRRT